MIVCSLDRLTPGNYNTWLKSVIYLFSIRSTSIKCFLASKADCICFCSSQEPFGKISLFPTSGSVASIFVAPLVTSS